MLLESLVTMSRAAGDVPPIVFGAPSGPTGDMPSVRSVIPPRLGIATVPEGPTPMKSP
jgi:hypothetical protein